MERKNPFSRGNIEDFVKTEILSTCRDEIESLLSSIEKSLDYNEQLRCIKRWEIYFYTKELEKNSERIRDEAFNQSLDEALDVIQVYVRFEQIDFLIRDIRSFYQMYTMSTRIH